MKDGLTPVFERIAGAAVLILGSPIYFGIVIGEMQSFMERLLFPSLTYPGPRSPLHPGTSVRRFLCDERFRTTNGGEP
jgi:multimeric flavodoxin WrbA